MLPIIENEDNDYKDSHDSLMKPNTLEYAW